MLKVQGLYKSFRGKKAVIDLNFTVEPGEVLGLLGPNGAGKSTALKSIVGLVRPDQGSISVCGHSFRDSPVEAKRNFGFLSDPPLFMENGTCWDHISFFAKAYGVANFEQKANALLERFRLVESKTESVTTLSKGMRQRLAILLVFMRTPAVILFDEPMTGLDPNAIRTVNELIKESSKAGASVILSSHLLPILEEVCSKVLVLDKGKSILYGTLAEIREKRQALKDNASLEEIFLYATKDKKAA